MTLRRDPDPSCMPLRRARKWKGWTLPKAAVECGVSMSFLCTLELGYRPTEATDEDIARVERVLGARAWELEPHKPVIFHACGGEP